MKPILLVIGTRPDAIKLIPLYFALKKEDIPVILCSTFQHDSLLKQVLAMFDVVPDVALNVMKENQDLFYLTEIILQKMKDVYARFDPALVVVQGDTTTAMASGLAAFYAHIPVAHVEAGIRSFDKYGPFPEEINRKIIASFADFNFAPTQNSVLNLLHEGVSRATIFQTGNTVTDALRIVRDKIAQHELNIDAELSLDIQHARQLGHKVVFFTVHRRESFGQPLEDIMDALKEFALIHKDVIFLFPVHPNPHVQKIVAVKNLGAIDTIKLYKPFSYENSVYLLSHCDLVVTDSGGLQEEAASLGKNAIIVRDRTDRPESVFAGMAKVVGSNKEKIKDEIVAYLYTSCDIEVMPHLYGDGYVSEKIVAVIKKVFDKNFMIHQKSEALQKRV